MGDNFARADRFLHLKREAKVTQERTLITGITSYFLLVLLAELIIEVKR